MIDMFYKETRFKETAVGKLPVDWKNYTLDEVSKEFISGGTPSTKKSEFWNGDIPWIRSVHLTGKYIDQSSVQQYITEKGLKRSAAKIVPRNSLIVATRVGVGKSALTLIDVAINQDLTGIVLDRSKVDGDFVVWYLHTQRVLRLLESFSRGTTIKGITQLSLKRLPIPCPPFIEQQEITKVLSVVDDIVQKTDEVIAKTKRLKRGLMQRLLTEGIGHTEFKDTKIGKIPKTWRVVNLGDKNVATLVMGQSPPSSTYNKERIGIPFLQGKAEFGEIYPTPDVYCSEPIKIAEENDVLISVRAPVGDVNIAPFKCCIGRGLSAIRAGTGKLHHSFLFYYLKFSNKRFEALSMGSTFKAIRKGEIENYKIPLPPFVEQEKIAEILSTIDYKLRLERTRKAKTERIKHGLMNDLLTGRIRVGVD